MGFLQASHGSRDTAQTLERAGVLLDVDSKKMAAARMCSRHRMLDGKIQNAIEALDKGNWILQRNAFQKQSLVQQHPCRIR